MGQWLVTRKHQRVDDRTSILEFLKRGRWFGGLDPALQQLIVQRAHVVRCARGDLLSEEGKPPTGLYAVLAGHVRVTRRLANGVEVPVHIAGKGFWTGEYATFSGQDRRRRTRLRAAELGRRRNRGRCGLMTRGTVRARGLTRHPELLGGGILPQRASLLCADVTPSCAEGT